MRAARVGSVYSVAHDHYFTERSVKALADIVCKSTADHGYVNAAASTAVRNSAKHPAAHPAIFTTSSETGSGIAELRTAVLAAALT